MSSDSLLRRGLTKRKIRDELDRLDSEDSLRDFIKASWKILEPKRAFQPGWHIDAICEHLEAVTNGQITRLLINIPPGCMKSLTTNVFWPAWEWGPQNRPDNRFVGASYSEALTVRDNRRCRTLIKSPWYQRLWGNRFQLIPEQDSKIRYDNDKTGFKIATSVGGLGTGERGDRWVIDDPHNIKDGESDAKREATLQWFEEVVPTRVNDPELSAIVIIMQRVHQRDVSGVILAKELDYVHLMLPMKFEPERKCMTSIGFEDPRTKDGELIWPDRFTPKVVERDEKIMTEYATASQQQQRPAPRGGGMFKDKWFNHVDEIPEGGEVVRAWDLAGTKSERAAFTCGVKIKRLKNGNIYIIDVVRTKKEPGGMEDLIVKTAREDGKDVLIDLPQDPGQAGKFQVRSLVRSLFGFNVVWGPETGSKEVRAEPGAAQAKAGFFHVLRALWNDDYIEEHCIFPYSEFQDQVDATSRGLSRLIPVREEYGVAGPKVVAVNA